ncbi:MAG: Gfo/Idh/MocA family oxidoreductase [bacterium]|nr:Gfo/Idh/MocA family oxidoreductase [bacterium]
MAKKKIRLGLIGCGGNMRGAHVPRILADNDVTLVCVADPDGAQARTLMEKYGREIAHYEDYKKMVRQEELDAVFISSPHSMHYEQARLALERELHVLVEKPLTTSTRHSKALIALAEKQKRFLQVSYQRNYYAPHMYARELVRTGAVGELRGVVAYVTQNWGGIKGWRLDPELSGGGMFMDTGSHLVASALWITGLEPAEVTAFMDNADMKVDINAVVNVRFKGGALGTLNTFGNASRHDERIAIHGSAGCIVFQLHQWKVESVMVNGEPMRIPARIKETSPDEAFFAWIRSGGRGYELPDFALQVARLSEAAYKSVVQKKPVKVAI